MVIEMQPLMSESSNALRARLSAENLQADR